MQQVKLFKSVESEVSVLEDEINHWLRESGARVISATGNIAPQTGKLDSPGNNRFPPSDVLVVMLYEPGIG
jgi:hypothetical protein